MTPRGVSSSQLEYKATWYGSTVVRADRFFPNARADATVQLVAGWIHQAVKGLHLASLHVRRYFLETYLVLREGPRG